MTAFESLTLVGLALNVVGATVLWVFGFPQPSFKPKPWVDQSVVGPDFTDEPERARVDRLRRVYRVLGHVGLGLLLLGFVLQVVGVVI